VLQTSNEVDDTRLAERILASFKDGVLVTDHQLRIIEVNEAFSRVTGYSRKEALGQTPRLLSSGRHGREFYERMWSSVVQNGHWQGTIWNRRKSGEIYPEWLSIDKLENTQGENTHYLAVFSDLSHQEAIQNQIHLLAYYDSLTGLPNRELFTDRLNLSLSLARREKQAVALFFLDLDRFKNINDTLGHSTGDQLLSAVANRLSTCLRESDTIARLGGDEFTVILSGITGKPQAENVAKKILDCFKQPYQVGTRDLHINTSIGISLFPQHGESSENLIRHADTAMYQAKALGKNRYIFYTNQMGSRHAHRVTLENELRKALSEASLSLAFQPQIDLSDNKVIAVEALARWQHPEIGAIPPDQFIPIAEETGLIHELGNWVMESACKTLAELRERFQRDLCLAINVSGIQLATGRMAHQVQDVLKRTGLPASTLELEITESVLMSDSHEALDSLAQLKSLGVQIAIDDFGTGYSSLSYIKRFAIDKLKIDRSFISDMEFSECDRQLVVTIINMAHDLSLQVIAEGIEQAWQLDYLRQAGCDQAQGYLIGTPMSGDDLALWLEAGTPAQIPTTATLTACEIRGDGK